MMKTRTINFADRYFLPGLFLFALLLRAAVVLKLANFAHITGYENERIALNILAGLGYSMDFFGPVGPTAHQYPLYTFYLLLHFWLFGKNYLYVELTQAVFGAGTCVLLVYLGRTMFERATAALAGMLCAVYPIYVYWTARGQALTIEIFIMISLLLFLHRAKDRDRTRDWLAAGIVLGLAILSKTLYIALIPAFVFWVRLNGKWALPRLLRRSAVFIITALLVVAPWTIRNAVTLHTFALVTTNGGYNLWVGNNPHATGSMFARDFQGMWTKVDDKMRQELVGASDPEKNRIFKAAALDYIESRPGRFLGLIPARLSALWWFEPYMRSDFPLFREIVYIVLLIPALCGMALSRRRWRELAIFYLIYLTLSAAYSTYYGEARFRYLIEFSFILFAAEFIVFIARRALPEKFLKLLAI